MSLIFAISFYLRIINARLRPIIPDILVNIYLSFRRTVDVQHKLHRHPMSSFLNAVVTANAAMTLDHLSLLVDLCIPCSRRDFHLHTLIFEGMN